MPSETGQIERALLLPTEPDAAGAALLMWRAGDLRDKVVQVYLDGELHDAIADAEQRETWLHVDRGRHHRIELRIVEPAQMWADLSDGLDGWSPAFVTRAALALVRDGSLPVDARVIVSVDGEDEPASRLWGPRDPRHGFGGLLGEGSFGLDDATGPGHGMGEFGAGPMGSDGEAWRWRDDELDAGEHAIGLRIESADGQTLGEIAPIAVTIDAPPEPPTDLRIDDTFLLTWTQGATR